jgi:hypothetical protein
MAAQLCACARHRRLRPAERHERSAIRDDPKTSVLGRSAGAILVSLADALTLRVGGLAFERIIHMSWTSSTPSSFVGQTVGDGQCVAFVRQASGAPQTALWKRGSLVKGGNSPQGTAIATFDPTGVYGNHIDGRSHAAIFHEQFPEGLLVWDQWFNHPSHQG